MRKKKDAVRWSLWLIRQCVKPLLGIRDILGKGNVYYRHISTKIADNALYSADVDLCAAERMYNNPANDKQIAEVHLQDTLLQCRILMCDIELYDLEENFLDGKFAAYKNMVARITKKYNCVGEEVVPDISMLSEGDEFKACGNDYAKLCDFVNKHPSGKFHGQALSMIHKIEDAAWPKTLSVEKLFEYKREFPNSHNENKIIEALDYLLLGNNNGVIADYRAMLKLFPAHSRISEIHDRIEFLVYDQCSSVSDCQEYLDAYPKGKYVSQVKNKVKAIKQNEIIQIFTQCKTISDFNRFILKYPTSYLCAKAKLCIEDLYWEDINRAGDIESYLKQYPNGRYCQEAALLLARKQEQAQVAEENRKFNACKKISDFKAYIKEYPNGRYIDIAKRVIQRHYRKLCVYVVTAVLIVAGVVVSLISFTSHTTDNASKAVDSVEPEYASTYETIVYESSEEVYNGNDQQDEIEDEWKNNRLSTGSRPYSGHYGRPLSGENKFRFKTSSGCDYVILIKRSYDDRYVDHKYVRGGDQVTITVPDGTYNVFLYTGNGWNPNKSVGACTGGFVSGESFQKDGPVTMTTTVEGDYYYNQTCEYTLYPVQNGNLRLESSNQEEAFN